MKWTPASRGGLFSLIATSSAITSSHAFCCLATQYSNVRSSLWMVKSSTIVSTSDYFRTLALDEHQQEVATGFAHFGVTTSDKNVLEKYPWKDSDFVSYSVGAGNAGPDEYVLENGDQIFQTKQPVFTKEECESLVQEARDNIAAGLKEQQSNENGDTTSSPRQRPRNSQLGEARASTLPKARAWLETKMQNTLLPLLESRFGCQAEDMTLHDALIIGYGYFGTPTQAQPLHRDSSILSLNVALSPSEDYEGGGTYFQGLNHTNGQETIQNQQGHVMCHAGGAMHAGRAIEKGQRWVLVLFLLSSRQPQLARRCHAHGTQAKQAGDWQSAFQALQEGLQIAPNDHQLHMDMGGVYASRGDFVEARRQLALTSRLYRPCYRAAYGLACDLDNKGRPRAALRWFEIALSRIDDSDLQPNAWAPLRLAAYDARVKAAQCAIVLAMRSPKFAKEYVPKAIDWIRVPLQKEPSDEILLGMLDAAKKLYDYS